MYSANGRVEILTADNFQQKVINSDQLWLVEFYAPWCGHCQQLAPAWEKAAKSLRGVVKVGALDADAHQQIGSMYGVRGFPTIKFFGFNKKKPVDYQGGRSSDEIVRYALQEVTNQVNKRMKGGSKKNKQTGGQE